MTTVLFAYALLEEVAVAVERSAMLVPLLSPLAAVFVEAILHCCQPLNPRNGT